MADVALPDSSYYIGQTRAGIDPFRELALRIEEYEFITCGMVVLEVSRGLRDPAVLRRFRERFAIMPFVTAGSSVWEQATQLAWTLDRKGLVLPATDLLIAACALHAKAAVLTRDAHFHEIPGLRVIEEL